MTNALIPDEDRKKVLPHAVWSILKEFKYEIEGYPNGFKINCSSEEFDKAKEHLKDNFFKYLESGQTIWIWDNANKIWCWIGFSLVPTYLTTLTLPHHVFLSPAIRSYSAQIFTIESTKDNRAPGRSPIFLGYTLENTTQIFGSNTGERLRQLGLEDPSLLLMTAFSLALADTRPLETLGQVIKNKQIVIRFDLIPEPVFNWIFQSSVRIYNFSYFMDFLVSTGFAAYFLPEFYQNLGCAQDPNFHEDYVVTHLTKTAEVAQSVRHTGMRFLAREKRNKTGSHRGFSPFSYDRDGFIKKSTGTQRISKSFESALPDDLKRIASNELETLALAALCHDIGKSATKEEHD